MNNKKEKIKNWQEALIFLFSHFFYWTSQMKKNNPSWLKSFEKEEKNFKHKQSKNILKNRVIFWILLISIASFIFTWAFPIVVFILAIKIGIWLIHFLKDIMYNLRRLFKFSIAFKLNVTYIIIFASLLFISNIAISGLFNLILTQNAQNQIKNQTNVIKETLLLQKNQDFLEGFLYDKEIGIKLKKNDKLVYEYKPKQSNFIKNIDLGEKNINLDFEYSNRIIHQEANLGQGIKLYVYKSLDIENFYTFIVIILLFIVSAIEIFITIGFGGVIAKRLLKPVRQMTFIAKSITVEDMSNRINTVNSKDELKELAETFNEMLDRIEDSYERQNQFVSDASHELRTPISVIQGYVNLLDRWGKEDKEVLQESINAIKVESENMKELIEKLLFLARTDKNKQKIERETFILEDFLNEICKETKMIDNLHEIECHINFSGEVFWDKKLIKQAIRVFIDNSIKFTPENGRIIIGCEDIGPRVMMYVRDTGVGIPKEDIPHVFERFYRSDKSRTKEKGGTGLGLSIAKWITENHGGLLTMESDVNQGTTMYMILPVK